jgi:hypothetical protein
MISALSDTTPAWQTRRAEILQKACTLIAQRLQSGEKVLRTINSIAKQFDNSSLGEGRRLWLSPKTLQRLWYLWRSSDRTPSTFALNYNGNAQLPIVDSLLLRALIHQSLQTGASLEEIVEKLNAGGARISFKDVRRAFPKGALAEFERSFRKLTDHRLQLEKNFIAAGVRWRRALLEQRTQTLRKILAQDAALERRILRHRDQLQRKFLQADARAVRQREQLQRKLLRRIEAPK